MRIVYPITVAALLASNPPAYSALPDHMALQENLRDLGTTEVIDWAHSPRIIEITIDEAALQPQFLDLQQRNYINRGLSEAYVSAHPIQMSLAVALTLVSLELRDAYLNTNIDGCNVTAILIIPDEYGRLRRRQIFSLKFDRKLSDRIDWERFVGKNLESVAIDFRYSEWAMSNINN